MGGHIRFKVKPKKVMHIVPCATELSSLLACFASSGDLRASTQCSTAAKTLHQCMATSKKPPKAVKSSINHLLKKV